MDDAENVRIWVVEVQMAFASIANRSTSGPGLSFLDEGAKPTLESVGGVVMDQVRCGGLIELLGRNAELGDRVIELATFNSGTHLANL